MLLSSLPPLAVTRCPIPYHDVACYYIVLPTTDSREIRLRRVATPAPDQQRLLEQLNVTIPAHLEWNAERSADFVTS